MPEPAFPRELLDQSPEARLGYFKSFTIAHPLLKEADAALKQAIQEPAGWSLIFVYGPTGVGKTTLRRRVEKHLQESMLETLCQDPGLVPVVSMEAAAPDSSQFSWKDYYRRALIALDEPLIERKLTHRVRDLFRDASGSVLTNSRAPGLELRMALESALIHRRPAAFFIDEAQHLAKMKSGRKLQDQLDSIKSLASLASTVHVLVGTYELLPFRNLSAQLSRRSIDIHFPRYHAERTEEYTAFRNAVFTLQRHLPLAGESDLLPHLEYCYERSIGCVGLVKDWLTRASALAINQGAHSVSRKMMEKTAWSLDQSERMAREAVDGESEAAENGQKRDRLKQLLQTGARASTPAQARVNPSPPLARTRVGQRKPVRDLVGATMEA
ncbi:MAG TPA: ATP-binding protein [Bryobacteraceae bacterium]|nr:ATP-binding protein [Bryobacteraceae bacterium]